MPKTKYLKGECEHCSGHIEFPADSIGMSVDCPHCGKQTELRLAAPPEEPTVPRRVIIWTAIAILILVGALVAAMLGLDHYKRQIALRREQAAAAPKTADPVPAPEDPVAKSGFEVSKIRLEKTAGSSLVYAVGTVNNKTGRQRFAVRIEMDLFDAQGQPVGTAKDYQAVIEANSQWKFKGLVVESKAVSAKLASLKEDQK